MRQYIDGYSVANTIRMCSSIYGPHITLVEQDSEVELVSVASTGHGYFVTTASNIDNLIDAVQILGKEEWKFACTSASPSKETSINHYGSLRAYPWFVDPWKEIVDVSYDDKMCVLVLSKSGEGISASQEGAAKSLKDPKWIEQNKHRISLIRKRRKEGLSFSEREKLDRLQSERSRLVNAAYPLPFDALDQLERYVENAESDLNKHEGSDTGDPEQ